MRKALVAGIDFYSSLSVPNLSGCVNDAYKVNSCIERHGDGSPNFGVVLRAASNELTQIDRRQLKDLVIELFRDESEIALFYFSGHGYIESTGGYLLTSDCQDGDDGLSMDDLLAIANDSKALNKIIVLDCCHSGAAGSPAITSGKAVLSEGVTILTASSKDQYAMEANGSGIFTTLFLITQMTPRMTPRARRVVHRYHSCHGAQRHSVPEGALRARVPGALRDGSPV